jgi:hypothetical protein
LSGDLLDGFKLVAGGNYKRMLNDFGDSPLTSIAGSRNQWQGAIGLAYTFYALSVGLYLSHAIRGSIASWALDAFKRSP